jgi:hypothetical protein
VKIEIGAVVPPVTYTWQKFPMGIIVRNVKAQPSDRHAYLLVTRQVWDTALNREVCFLRLSNGEMCWPGFGSRYEIIPAKVVEDVS